MPDEEKSGWDIVIDEIKDGLGEVIDPETWKEMGKETNDFVKATLLTLVMGNKALPIIKTYGGDPTAETIGHEIGLMLRPFAVIALKEALKGRFGR